MIAPLSDDERFENFKIELEKLCIACGVQLAIDCEDDVISVFTLRDGDPPIYEDTPLVNKLSRHTDE